MMASRNEWAGVYKRAMDFDKKMIAFAEKDIERLNREINRCREEDKRIKEYVWSKGVLTKIEMEIYGKKNYKSVEMEKLERERQRAYRDRKRWERQYRLDVSEYEYWSN